jgi:hypothetical protein
MSKLICYALFHNETKQPFETSAYVRGFYFNCRMNNLIYPDWRTHLEVDRHIYSKYQLLFDWLVTNNNLSLCINEVTPPLCEGMLWRMKPIFTIDVDHVLCRDSDAITTYKEAQAVQTWLEINKAFHAILDNPAHGGLMGGMVGFNCSMFKSITKFHSFQEFINGQNLSTHGSDQNYLNKLNLEAYTFFDNCAIDKSIKVPGVDKKYWESNLTCRHIGSAGVVEMETIRFFQRHDAYQWKFDVIEKQLPNLFYWHL